jgi:hypothetical protein
MAALSGVAEPDGWPLLRFEVYRDGALAKEVDLSGAYVFGQDAIPVRADIAFLNGIVSCIKRVPGACGLSLLWPARTAGTYMLSTTRLPEMDRPYNLNVELARGQVMRICQKIEEWGLFDYPEAQDLNDEFEKVRALFIDALKSDTPARMAETADEALDRGITLGERLALFHAEVFLARRRSPNAARPAMGCVVDLFSTAEVYQDLLRDACDVVTLPMPWKHTEPKERVFQYTQTDTWINWATRARKRIHAGPLLSFQQANLPDWLYIFEHDYDTLRDLIYEHIQRIVRRYERQVRTWIVASGISAHNSFNLSFDQLMELTRMSCLLVKKLAPRSAVLIDLVMPWGEYYARNQRTIPPLLYADMAVQSGVKFDGFGLNMCMGVPVDGFYVRDLLQISSLLDEFVLLGKPVHVTACQVPSDILHDQWDAWDGKFSADDAGRWHAPWSQRLQAEWLSAFARLAVSRPVVESICWRDMCDYEGHYLPHGGLCRSNSEPKLSYREMRNFRASFIAPKPAAEASQPPPPNGA